MVTPEQLAARFASAKLDKERLMSRITLKILGESQRRTPVLTGNLRRSETSRVEASGERGVVGTTVDYAQIVHERKPFFEQGLAASRDTIDQLLEEAGLELFTEIAG